MRAATGGSVGRTIRVYVGSGEVTCKEAGGTEIELLAASSGPEVRGMSGDVLTDDADRGAGRRGASEGQTSPEEQARPQRRRGACARSTSRARAKFTADQQRRLERALETFCRTASTRLSAELRVPIELELLNIDQLTLVDAHAQVPAAARSARSSRPSPLGHAACCSSTELPLVLRLIERLLGGAAARQGRARAS